MTSRILNLVVIGLFLSVAGLGCKKGTPHVTKLPTGAGTVGPGTTDLSPGPGLDNAGGQVTATPDAFGQYPAGSGHPGWGKAPDVLAAQTVHFDFDSAVVKSGEQSKVDAVAEYLKSNPQNAVEIEGHCDERGTEEGPTVHSVNAAPRRCAKT